MRYKEKGFRAFYKQFTAVMLTDSIQASIADFPGVEAANCILTYGYIDHEAGLTLEVLAAGRKTAGGFQFADGINDIRSMIRIETVEDEDFYWFQDEDETLAGRYKENIEMLRSYEVSEEIETTRGMEFLDSSRDPYCIDDVLVYLTKEGLEPEGCWTRIIGLGDHWLVGTLLNEPEQNYGYHLGEQIGFFLKKTDDGETVCYSDMNPSRKLTAQDLEDGSMLKGAVSMFNKERTEDHFFDLLEFLRDSYVWIPCTAVMSEADQERWNKAVEDAGDDLDSLIGMELSNQDEIRMVPDILSNGDHFFFPVFSSAEEMGEYGNDFSKVQKHFLEAISLAKNNKKEIAGIVLNAFTEPFVLDKEVFDIVEKMKTRLSE